MGPRARRGRSEEQSGKDDPDDLAAAEPYKLDAGFVELAVDVIDKAPIDQWLPNVHIKLLQEGRKMLKLARKDASPNSEHYYAESTLKLQEIYDKPKGKLLSVLIDLKAHTSLTVVGLEPVPADLAEAVRLAEQEVRQEYAGVWGGAHQIASRTYTPLGKVMMLKVRVTLLDSLFYRPTGNLAAAAPGADSAEGQQGREQEAGPSGMQVDGPQGEEGTGGGPKEPPPDWAPGQLIHLLKRVQQGPDINNPADGLMTDLFDDYERMAGGRLRQWVPNATKTARGHDVRDEIFDIVRPLGWTTEVPDPPGLGGTYPTRLYRYQRRALAWMCWREAAGCDHSSADHNPGMPLAPALGAGPSRPPLPPKRPAGRGKRGNNVEGRDLAGPSTAAANQAAGADEEVAAPAGWKHDNRQQLVWGQVKLPNGLTVYVDAAQGRAALQRPPHLQRLRGGMLCDEMGLGKTVEVIALLLAQPPNPGLLGVPFAESPLGVGLHELAGASTSAAARGKKGRSYKAAAAAAAGQDKAEGSQQEETWAWVHGPTLIVTPPSLTQQWAGELRRHSKLRVIEYEGMRELHSSRQKTLRKEAQSLQSKAQALNREAEAIAKQLRAEEMAEGVAVYGKGIGKGKGKKAGPEGTAGAKRGAAASGDAAGPSQQQRGSQGKSGNKQARGSKKPQQKGQAAAPLPGAVPQRTRVKQEQEEADEGVGVKQEGAEEEEGEDSMRRSKRRRTSTWRAAAAAEAMDTEGDGGLGDGEGPSSRPGTKAAECAGAAGTSKRRQAREGSEDDVMVDSEEGDGDDDDGDEDYKGGAGSSKAGRRLAPAKPTAKAGQGSGVQKGGKEQQEPPEDVSADAANWLCWWESGEGEQGSEDALQHKGVSSKATTSKGSNKRARSESVEPSLGEEKKEKVPRSVKVLRDKLAEKQREARQAASAAERALAEADAPEDGRILAAKAVQDLAGSCDVVLTTYAVLAKEVHYTTQSSERSLRYAKKYPITESPLLQIAWHRVVLDEAQMVGDGWGAVAIMASRLQSPRRWCLTGTPIGTGGLSDIYGALKVLQYMPLNDPGTFRRVINDPYLTGTAEGHQRLALLLKPIMWRNSKAATTSDVTLPPRTLRHAHMRLGPAEQKIYDHIRGLAAAARQEWKQLQKEQQEAAGAGSSRNQQAKQLAQVSETAKTQLYQLRLAVVHPQLTTYWRSLNNARQLAHGADRGGGVLTTAEMLATLRDEAQLKLQNAERDFCVASNLLASRLVRQAELLKSGAAGAKAGGRKGGKPPAAKSKQQAAPGASSNAGPSRGRGRQGSGGAGGVAGRGAARQRQQQQEGESEGGSHSEGESDLEEGEELEGAGGAGTPAQRARALHEDALALLEASYQVGERGIDAVPNSAVEAGLAREAEGVDVDDEGQLQLGEEAEEITAAAASWRAWRFVQVHTCALLAEQYTVAGREAEAAAKEAERLGKEAELRGAVDTATAQAAARVAQLEERLHRLKQETLPQLWEAASAAGAPMAKLMAKLSKDCLPPEAAAVATENAALAAEHAAVIRREKKDKVPEKEWSKPPKYKEGSYEPAQWMSTVLAKWEEARHKEAEDRKSRQLVAEATGEALRTSLLGTEVTKLLLQHDSALGSLRMALELGTWVISFQPELERLQAATKALPATVNAVRAALGLPSHSKEQDEGAGADPHGDTSGESDLESDGGKKLSRIPHIKPAGAPGVALGLQEHSADTLRAAASSEWALHTVLPRFVPQRVVLRCSTKEEAASMVKIFIEGHLTITNDVEGTQAVRRRLQTMANQLKKYSGDLMQSARTAPGLYELLVSCPLEAVQKAGEAVKAQLQLLRTLKEVHIAALKAEVQEDAQEHLIADIAGAARGEGAVAKQGNSRLRRLTLRQLREEVAQLKKECEEQRARKAYFATLTGKEQQAAGAAAGARPRPQQPSAPQPPAGAASAAHAQPSANATFPQAGTTDAMEIDSDEPAMQTGQHGAGASQLKHGSSADVLRVERSGHSGDANSCTCGAGRGGTGRVRSGIAAALHAWHLPSCPVMQAAMEASRAAGAAQQSGQGAGQLQGVAGAGRCRAVEVVELDDAGPAGVPASTSHPGPSQAAAPARAPACKAKPDMEVMDLTLDSDSEDDNKENQHNNPTPAANAGPSTLKQPVASQQQQQQGQGQHALQQASAAGPSSAPAPQPAAAGPSGASGANGSKFALPAWLLQEEEEGQGDECVICKEIQPAGAALMMFTCGHWLCEGCFHDHFIQHQRAECPNCRREIKRKDAFRVIASGPAGADGGEAAPGSSAEREINPPEGRAVLKHKVMGEWGTKIEALLRRLLHLKATAPQEKALVFSQFPPALELVSNALKLNGLEHVSLLKKGKGARDCVHRFNNDDKVKVFLLSLTAGAAGLTLVRANHVLLLDLSADPAVEQQAVARVHRIGQERPVTVTRLLCDGTVETQILEALRKKQRLFMESQAVVAEGVDERPEGAAGPSSPDGRGRKRGRRSRHGDDDDEGEGEGSDGKGGSGGEGGSDDEGEEQGDDLLVGGVPVKEVMGEGEAADLLDTLA